MFKLQEVKIDPDYICSTFDFTSLYSNIPHERGISAVGKFLENYNLMPTIQEQFLIDGIDFILKQNLFNFNGDLYWQTEVTAMGTCLAPSFANLYMDLFETNYIMAEQPWRENTVFYMWYIDDLIFVWKSTTNDLTAFTNYINTNTWGLTFSGNIDPHNINYLDVTLFSENYTILIKTFLKKVDCSSLLEFYSFPLKKWLIVTFSIWTVQAAPAQLCQRLKIFTLKVKSWKDGSERKSSLSLWSIAPLVKLEKCHK